jgi:hypothetical protein
VMISRAIQPLQTTLQRHERPGKSSPLSIGDLCALGVVMEYTVLGGFSVANEFLMAAVT